jgi:hypothetical protein
LQFGVFEYAEQFVEELFRKFDGHPYNHVRKSISNHPIGPYMSSRVVLGIKLGVFGHFLTIPIIFRALKSIEKKFENVLLGVPLTSLASFDGRHGAFSRKSRNEQTISSWQQHHVIPHYDHIRTRSALYLCERTR